MAEREVIGGRLVVDPLAPTCWRIVPERPLSLRPGDWAEYTAGTPRNGEPVRIVIYRASWPKRWWTRLRALARGRLNDLRGEGWVRY